MEVADLLAPNELENTDLLKTNNTTNFRKINKEDDDGEFTFDLASKSSLFMASANSEIIVAKANNYKNADLDTTLSSSSNNNNNTNTNNTLSSKLISTGNRLF